MEDKIFSKEEWVKALEGLKDSHRIFVPIKEGDYHTFGILSEENRPDFDFQNTRLSPKSLILPQSERMFDYSLDEKSEAAHILKETPKDFSPQAIVGLRPCDALAIQLVNLNFDNPEYRDPWWVRGLESTTFVGLGCNEPCSTCFCSSTGGGPFNEKGLDVLLYDLGDNFFVRSLSPKGESLLEKVQGGKSADGSAKEAAEKLYQELLDAGVEVILDDRNVRPGVMFNDMELIGIPHRVVIGERGLDQGVLEYRKRTDSENGEIPLDGALQAILERLA